MVEGRKRNSRDEKVNREGRKLVKFIEKRGWSIFNGTIEEDMEGEFTFTEGRECTVIDYITGGEKVKDRVRRIRVGDKVNSNR